MMTKEEIMKELRSNTPINKARAAFSHWSARIEQAGQQRKPLDPITMRGMEFEAVMEIWEILSGVGPSLAEKEAKLEVN